MEVWGLTGGIASGKSTAAGYFAAQGAGIVDADAIYHQLLLPGPSGQPSPLAQRIAAHFPGCLAADGTLQRDVLAPKVFASPAARSQLEQLTHPAIAAQAQQQLAQLAAQGHDLLLYSMPLLYELNAAARFAGVVVIWVPPALQLARLMARNQLPQAAARARLAAQLPIDEKRARADLWLDNSGTPHALAAQIKPLRTPSQLRAAAAAQRG